MNNRAISDKRLNAVIDLAKQIWKQYSPYELQQKMVSLWQDITRETGIKFIPLYKLQKDEIISCAVFGSGSFSTGKKELEIARELKNYLGWLPVNYTLIVTNRRKSNARAVFEEFTDLGMQYVELDFAAWYRKNYDPNSQSTIKDTRFFYPPGTERPSEKVIKRNFTIRKEFDKTLHDEIVKHCEFPTSISLRGYNFPVFTSLIPKGRKILVDDTHPADMSYLDSKTKHQLYAGWQSGATGLMKKDGHTLYRTSLIAIDLLDTYADSQKVDTGVLYLLSPGTSPSHSWSPKAIQITMKETEDYFLNALKATGLFPYLWGISEEPEEVTYNALKGKTVNIKQRMLVVGDQVRSGKEAWGQTLADIEHIKKLFL